MPTTSYNTKRPLIRNLLPADHRLIQPHEAHMPLAIMLVLTQLSVGGFLVQGIFEWMHGRDFASSLEPIHATVSLALGLIALGASVLHLGRPLYAFRVIIGLRTSWLSREVVAFATFAALASAYAISLWNPPGETHPGLMTCLQYAVTTSGILGVACSVMVYHDTRRPCWHAGRTGVKFALTTLVLGLAVVLLSGWIAGSVSGWGTAACRLLVVTAVAKMIHESLVLLSAGSRVHRPLKRTALLLLGPLRPLLLTRVAFGIAGGIALPLLMTVTSGSAEMSGLAAAVFLLTLTGEFLERHLFFVSAVAPKMPGAVTG